MGAVVGILMGEIARIVMQCQPEEVRVLFWDSKVCNAHKFLPKDYAQIGKLMQPKGGGGTTVSCIADWVATEKLKVKATIILTDTYFESNPRLVPGPILWGVLDRPNWTPPRGQALHLSSLQM
jgi:predicted metal-dependent peptidase